MNLGPFQAQFAKQLRSDLKERLAYATDMGEMPPSVRTLVKTTPDAVFRVEQPEDLVQLVKLARSHKVPLTPRGSGTSGFGSALASKGGISVDLSGLNKILALDPQAQSARVQPGVTWHELEQALLPYGLRTRTYPTSAISATVGGWLALNGAGVGSFEFGRVENCVTELSVISPKGDLLHLTAEEVKPYLGSEGILGFIVEATLRLRPLEQDEIRGYDFASTADGVSFLQQASQLPLWHLAFSTGDFVRKDAQAAGSDVPGKSLGLRILLAAPASRQVGQALGMLAAGHHGAPLPEVEAERAWNHRFHPMRMKSLGPSLVPSEAETPLRTLPALLQDLAQRLPGMAFEGNFTCQHQISLLGFALSDARSLRYNVDFLQALKVLRLAQKHGGRPYGFGLYFSHAANEHLPGYARIEELKRFTDPDKIMNPGKILEHNERLAWIMGAAETLTPLAEKVGIILPDKPLGNGRLPADLRTYAYTCAQCGYCKTQCTLYNATPWESSSPRGKFALLRLVDQGVMSLTQDLVDSLLMCTTCKRCEPVCQLGLPIEQIWTDMREWLVSDKKRRTYAAFEMMASSLRHEGNIWAHLKDARDAWMPEDARWRESGETGYWAGCTASFVEQDIAQNAVRILNAGGIEPAYLGKDELCCGVPMLMAGLWDRWEETMRANISEINKRGIKELVVSCPGCHVSLHHHYRTWAKKLGIDWDVRVLHISEKTAGMVSQGSLKFTHSVDTVATWHDPCHIGRHAGLYNPPRETLNAIPGLTFVEMEHSKENSLCCGSVLTRISDTSISDSIALRRFQEAEAAGAQDLVTTCPCCEFQLRVGRQASKSPVMVRDFATMVAKGLGYADDTDLSESTALSEWVVFDQMITAMSVEEIAKMMSVMMPRMMELLPGWMKSMMSTTKPLPSGAKDKLLAAMRGMVPQMMPALLPGMLPRMVPDVIRYMEDLAPSMPQAMRQLMPKMLPEVMERLMPKVLHLLIPLILDEMLKNMKQSLMTASRK